MPHNDINQPFKIAHGLEYDTGGLRIEVDPHTGLDIEPNWRIKSQSPSMTDAELEAKIAADTLDVMAAELGPDAPLNMGAAARRHADLTNSIDAVADATLALSTSAIAWSRLVFRIEAVDEANGRGDMAEVAVRLRHDLLNMQAALRRASGRLDRILGNNS